MRPDESNEEESAEGGAGSVVVARLEDRAPSGLMPARLGSVDYLEAEDVLDLLHDEQLSLSEELDSLTRLLAERGSPLDGRQAVSAVRDALAVFYLSAGARPVPRGFLPDAALARYLRALYAVLRAAIDEAKNRAPSSHDAPLPQAAPVRDELATVAENAADPDAVRDLTAAFERLVAAVDGARSALA